MQPGVGGVGGGPGHQHRQRRDALAQVGAGDLAGLDRVGGDVEDVVGELERRADDLAVRRQRLLDLAGWRRRSGRRSAPRWRSASRSCRRRPRGSGRAGPRPSAGCTVSRIWPSTSRVNVCAWIRTASAPRSAVSSEDFENRKSPVRIATWLPQIECARVGAAAQVRLVHHVVVVERREVGELDDARGGDDLVGVRAVAGLGGEQHEQRPEPLAAGRHQVAGGLGDERGPAADVPGQRLLDHEPSGREADRREPRPSTGSANRQEPVVT